MFQDCQCGRTCNEDKQHFNFHFYKEKVSRMAYRLQTAELYYFDVFAVLNFKRL